MTVNTSPDVANSSNSCGENTTQKVALDQRNGVTSATPQTTNVAKGPKLATNSNTPKASQTDQKIKPPPGGWRRQSDGTTREERRAANVAKKLAVQTQEIAASNAVPVKLSVQFKATREGDMLPEKIAPPTGKGSQPWQRAKTIAAVGEEPTGGGTAVGRPSEYTQEEGDAICSWISRGGSLNSYCKATGRNHVTVFKWLRERADFLTRYSLALENRADTLVDEMTEIADNSAVAPTMEGVQAAKLRVETRRWIAAKLKSRVYGDRVEVKQTGAVSIRLGIGTQPSPAKPTAVVEDVTPKLSTGEAAD